MNELNIEEDECQIGEGEDVAAVAEAIMRHLPEDDAAALDTMASAMGGEGGQSSLGQEHEYEETGAHAAAAALRELSEADYVEKEEKTGEEVAISHAEEILSSEQVGNTPGSLPDEGLGNTAPVILEARGQMPSQAPEEITKEQAGADEKHHSGNIVAGLLSEELSEGQNNTASTTNWAFSEIDTVPPVCSDICEGQANNVEAVGPSVVDIASPETINVGEHMEQTRIDSAEETKDVCVDTV